MNNLLELYKNQLLSAYENDSYAESNLTGIFGVINRSSNVYIQNTTIVGGTSITDTSNNGDTKIDNCILKNAKIQNYITKNSIVNITENNINTISGTTKIPNKIQKGSIYNYPNPLVSTQLNNLLNDITDVSTEELVIPLSCIAKNKNDIISNYYQNLDPIYRDGLGDGMGWLSSYTISSYIYDLHMSSHYTQNKRFAYWSNLYRGQFTGDSYVYLTKGSQFVNFMKKIPRNLNGYTLTISGLIISNNSIAKNLRIQNFYNGTIKISVKNLQIVNAVIENNNCTIDFNNCYYPYNTQMYDNKDIIFNDVIQNNNYIIPYEYSIIGDNNIVMNYSDNIISGLFTLSSYNNKCVFKNNVNNSNLWFYQNSNNNGNQFYLSSNTINGYIDAFTNHYHNDLPDDITNKLTANFKINDVSPKKYRDCIDVGSIIGWVQNSQKNPPIPKGFYICDGSKIPIDLNNPKDNYYNGQLTYLLCGNIVTNGFIQLPNIPIVTVNGYKLMYIIKYNNNFEHLEY